MANSFFLDEEEDLLNDHCIVEIKTGKERGTLQLSGRKCKTILKDDLNSSVLIKKKLSFVSGKKSKKPKRRRRRIQRKFIQKPILKIVKFKNFLRKRSRFIKKSEKKKIINFNFKPTYLGKRRKPSVYKQYNYQKIKKKLKVEKS